MVILLVQSSRVRIIFHNFLTHRWCIIDRKNYDQLINQYRELLNHCIRNLLQYLLNRLHEIC